jgi:hypothetical protein
MKDENQGKTDTQREFALFMFSTAMLGLIVLGLVYLIKFGFNL